MIKVLSGVILLCCAYQKSSSNENEKVGNNYGLPPNSKVRRHAFAALPGLLIDTSKWTIALNSITLPAWCVAARGTGTRYKRVVMPNATWTFAIAKAAIVAVRVRGGRAARIRGVNVRAYRAAVAKYVDVAYVEKQPVEY